MTALETRIKSLADAYYQGNEQISDEEYDALIDQLRRESPKSDLLPENQGITGSDLKGIDKKYKLPITMGTLAKCNTDEQFKVWWTKHPHDDIVVETKCDGAGVVLHYENGKFAYARSRGDSEYGTDLTDKAEAIGVPSQLCLVHFNPDGSKLAKNIAGGSTDIRGEVIIKKTTFDEKYKGQFKNGRNMVSGLLGQKEVSPILKDCMFIAYDVFDNPGEGSSVRVDDSEMSKLDFLIANEFNVPKYEHYCIYQRKEDKTVEEQGEEIFNKIKEWKDSIDTSNPADGIPCDGIVIKQNKVNKDDLMRHTPLNNVAYKPNLQIAVTKVVDIEWTLSGRYLSPVAIVEPVELCGTTVKRASLANINKMEELGIEIGSTVEITKRGEIIPKVMKVVA